MWATSSSFSAASTSCSERWTDENLRDRFQNPNPEIQRAAWDFSFGGFLELGTWNLELWTCWVKQSSKAWRSPPKISLEATFPKRGCRPFNIRKNGNPCLR